jgi:hypothetical protein
MAETRMKKGRICWVSLRQLRIKKKKDGTLNTREEV